MNQIEPPDSDGVPQLDLDDGLDRTVVTIPLYEPAGQQIVISGRDLCTHTLVLGQTGSGKTTAALRWFLKGLIAHDAGTADKCGVFVFDMNADDTVGLVQKWSAEYGRTGDVRLLTAEAGHLDLFAHLRSLEDLSSMTAQFMHGDWVDDSDNAYWFETTRMLIDAALTVCLVAVGKIESDTAVRLMTNWLIANRLTPEDEALLKQFERRCAEAPGKLDKHTLGKLEFIRATISMWAKLDVKTKGILVSCLANALSGFLSLETRKYLDPERGSSFCPEELVEGRIMVFSLPAGRHLESASLLGRLIKARLFTALQERPPNRNQRLCAILADEYHYLASGGVDRSSDVTALATLRSRNVAMIAATQSLDHLASVMGPRDFRSLLPNFGNHFFFRSTEGITSAFATAVMGMRRLPDVPTVEAGNLLLGVPPAAVSEFVCPPGALAGLEPCEAYVSTSSGYRSPGAIWLGANHETPDKREESPGSPVLETSGLSALRAAVLEKSSPPLAAKDSRIHDSSRAAPSACYELSTWRRLLEEDRFQRTKYASFEAFRQALGHDPDGLASLPICWWEAIVKLVTGFTAKYPLKFLELRQQQGHLLIAVIGDSAPPETYLDWIVRLQRSLYPIRTRPLKRKDCRLLDSEDFDGYSLDGTDEEG